MKSKTVFFEGAGNAVIREVEVPDPYNNEIQVKSLVNGICMFETWAYATGAWRKDAYIPGHEGIGVVIKAGKAVENVKEGDLVTTRQWTQICNIPDGGFMKLQTVPKDINSFMVEPAACMVLAAKHSDIFPSDKAIVFGAGYMGLLLIQILARYPLSGLTVVDIKEDNLKLAKEFGAIKTINSSTDEGRKKLQRLNPDSFDIAYECSGAKGPLDMCTYLTRPGGRIGIIAWHHGDRQINTGIWHQKGLNVINLSPEIRNGVPLFKYFRAAEILMKQKSIKQNKLITHVRHFMDIHNAMEEAVSRPAGFIKSILVFDDQTVF